MSSNTQNLVTLILKAAALALSVASIALGTMKALSPENGVSMLGLGVCCLALASLRK